MGVGWRREGKCCITGYINSITQLAEAEGNDESDRGEHTPGNWGGGKVGEGLVVFCRLCWKQQNVACRSWGNDENTPQGKGRGEKVGGGREGVYYRFHDQCMLVAKHRIQKHKGMMRVKELGFAHPREVGGGWGETGVPYSCIGFPKSKIQHAEPNNSNYTIHV